MRSTLRWRTWLYGVAAIVSGVLAVATLLWHDWAEVLFDIDPDQGSGWFEFGVTAVFGLIAIATLALTVFDVARNRRPGVEARDRDVV
jgi:hypothetical protein